MKKSKIIALLLLVCLVFAACSSSAANTYGNDISIERTDTPNIRIFIDHETGVEYFYSLKGGIFPRLNADGSLYINEEASGNE